MTIIKRLKTNVTSDANRTFFAYTCCLKTLVNQ